jgi:hypothetical protein
MLTEGWDANTVTQVLGLRAFTSQLLCEQVVGRGLRRMDYQPDPATGLLTEEYCDVYGVPFSVIPFRGRPVNKPERLRATGSGSVLRLGASADHSVPGGPARDGGTDPGGDSQPR